MRILYSHYLTNANHPAARMVQTIADQLQVLGHEVLIHGSDGDWKESSVGSAPPAKKSLFSRWKTKFWFIRGIANNRASFKRDMDVLRNFQPEVILCRNDPYRFSMPKVAKQLDIPLVTYADAPSAYEARRFASDRWNPPGLLEWIERRVLKASKAVVTISAPARRILETYRTNVPIHDIPNGVDPNLFPKRSPVERVRTRHTLGIRTPNVAGFAGSFQNFHGIPLLAQLIEATANRSDLTWLLVGDGPERAALERAARNNPRVIFTGRQPHHRMGELICAMDILVAPHLRERGEFYFSPLKILEGMAAGAVCLASSQGDIPMMLAGGNAGVLVDTDSVDDWHAGLKLLIEDERRRAQMARAARGRVQESFTWLHTASEVARILESVTKRSNRLQLV